MDICFPNNNEDSFLARAKQLGITDLVFVYQNKQDVKHISGCKAGLLVKPQDIMKAKQAKLLAVCVGSREAIERKADIAFDFEKTEQKQHTHHRSSGLNHVLCNLATQNKVTIGYSFSSILTAKNRAVLLGKMAQSLKFCKKSKTKTLFASFAETPEQLRSPHDLAAFRSLLE